MSDSSAWKFNIDDWTVGDLMDWDKALAEGLGPQTEMMCKIVTAWPYEGDPKDMTVWRGLSLAQWKQARAEVMKAVNNFFRTA